MTAPQGFLRLQTSAGPRWALERGGALQELADAPWEGVRETGVVLQADLPRLPPVTPSKIVCIGRNYAKHARELGNELPKEPLIFLKPPSALVGDGAAIVRPRSSTDVQYEAELGLVIGRRARRVPREAALEYVFGLTCVNDVTARDIQREEKQFTRAKGFDTFCPVGPRIVPFQPATRSVRCLRNGATKQDGHTRDLIFDLAAIVAYVSRVMTLEPGDLIATGTPEGVGPVVAGDVVEIVIEGVGTLRSPVVDEEDA